MYRRYIVIIETDNGPQILGPFTKAHANRVKDDMLHGDTPAVVYQLYRVYS